ncbi:glycoside hydrolase family 3 N-terminal domain-containing protein [Actinacidiphila bryophytorum]|uniref:glycoside hydrolase family 3 N-terminal domain-containing protein n=1 Tax=Actinacidiphila bryophytorum TaxID=1436133 RepID=UPI002176DCF9|nr:glycoside hydrolase family 3 N-terminal domain-containing protein [Actinacidiphila bryophytorum]UWE13280.1 beta-N-acetylhexosaminidase [Actinacidiphila bryophytorum]
MAGPGRHLTRRGVLAAGSGAAAAAAVGALGRSGRPAGGTATAPAAYAAPAALTPQQQAGQRVILSYSGTTVPQSLLDQISAGQAAGVIFFGGNISSLAQITSAVAQLRQANRSSPNPAPLLLMTDQEGGQIRRLPGAPVQSAKQIGASADPAGAAASAGTGAGNLLRSVGMNVNLAPVLDVYRTAGDFEDQYERSFSTDPEVVSVCGSSFITAQRATGVAATAKHFPGLGPASATQNTDLRPVTLKTSLSELRNIDEVPYTAALTAGVDLVMVSWAIYSRLDSAHPAGLSPTVVQSELRDRFSFTGVTVTDAINAGALSALGTPGQNAVTAAAAGMDLILDASQDVTKGKAVVSALAAALQNGTLDATASAAALGRVNALRNRLF